MAASLKTYFSNTKNILYSFLFSLPLLLAYEILILIAQPDAQHAVRISVDIWFKQLFSLFSVNTVSVTLLIAFLAGLVILYRERHRLRTLKFRYFPYMLAESFVYSVAALFLAQYLLTLILQLAAAEPAAALTGMQKLALSLGAGLYEELFFRVILVSVLLMVFERIFKGAKWAAAAAAMVVSALLFSAVHYIGEMGDLFTLSSFLFRFIFGLILNGIYIWRGFGIAAWTHALYDIIVMLIL